MDWATQGRAIGEVASAMLLGGLIGLEREIADKPAGFRTHMLVAGAAALLVALGDAMVRHWGARGPVAAISADPTRVVQAIVTGISFLGAGTIILRSKTEQVEGLTTAASILLSSAIGIAVALRQYVVAVGVTALALVVLAGLRTVEGWLRRRRGQRHDGDGRAAGQTRATGMEEGA
jgi:putative Mg2+ transporter-C (MgtC) family protein